jgi:hypothetical protein
MVVPADPVVCPKQVIPRWLGLREICINAFTNAACIIFIAAGGLEASVFLYLKGMSLQRL